MFQDKDDITFTPYLAGYINTTSSLHLKIAGMYNMVEDGSNFPSASGTLFLNFSNFNWLVPSVTLNIAKEKSMYGGALDFKFGNSLNIIGGVFVFKSRDIDWTVGFNIGVMFIDVSNIKIKDI